MFSLVQDPYPLPSLEDFKRDIKNEILVLLNLETLDATKARLIAPRVKVRIDDENVSHKR